MFPRALRFKVSRNRDARMSAAMLHSQPRFGGRVIRSHCFPPSSLSSSIGRPFFPARGSRPRDLRPRAAAYEARIRVLALATHARESRGTPLGQRGQDKLRSNPRVSRPANYESLRVRRKRGVAPRPERERRTPPTSEAMRQMLTDRKSLVSLKRAVGETRRSTTSTDRDRRQGRAPTLRARPLRLRRFCADPGAAPSEACVLAG